MSVPIIRFVGLSYYLFVRLSFCMAILGLSSSYDRLHRQQKRKGKGEEPMPKYAQSVAVPVIRITAAVLIAIATGVALLTDTAAYGGPPNGTVVRGQVSFTQNGNQLTIQASDGSIINYSNFDILPNEVVRFLQPNDNARRDVGAVPGPVGPQGYLRH